MIGNSKQVYFYQMANTEGLKAYASIYIITTEESDIENEIFL